MSDSTEDQSVKIPKWVYNTAISLFRGAVVLSCAAAWAMYLDVRDIKREFSDPRGFVLGSMSKTDWEYEKKLMLVQMELQSIKLDELQMDLERLEGRR